MKPSKMFILIGLCLLSLFAFISVFTFSVNQATSSELKNNTKMFAIDSVIYRQPGADHTLQVTPYWKCHLKGTNVWVTVRNQKPGDSISMIVKY